MNYKIKIDGEDYTSKISGRTVVHITQKGKAPSILNFDIIFNNEIPPNIESKEVLFYIDSVLKFGGKITRVSKKHSSKTLYVLGVQVQDFSRILQMGNPIAEIYRNYTVKQIIDDIISKYSFYSDFTSVNVDCDTEIDYYFCDHKTFWEVLGDLSERTATEFYIDENKNIFFFTAGKISGDSVLEDNKSYIQRSLSVKEQSDKVFNYYIVQGGEYDGSELVTESKTADGTKEISILGRYSGVSVTVNSVSKKVGVFGLNDELMPSVYDCLYDFSGRKIVFDDTTKPTSGQTVDISGHQKIRVIVQVSDAVSISKYGIIPKKTKNSALKTKASAFQFAKAELGRYAQEVSSGGFNTRIKNFRAGQRISVDFLGEKRNFDITKTTTMFNPQEIWETKVDFASADIVDSIKILSDLLAEKNSSHSAEEILEVLRGSNETVNIGEVVEVNGNLLKVNIDLSIEEVVILEQDREIEFVLAEYTPTDFSTDNKRNFLLDGSTLS